MPTAEAQESSRLEYFRLPTTGRDPIFGIGRGSWIRLNKDGRIRFSRLNVTGNKYAGIIFINIAEARKLLKSLATASN